jgi:CheY-like chemotaxis protein
VLAQNAPQQQGTIMQGHTMTRKRVLLADDDAFYSEMAKSVLLDAGFDVTVLADGLKALSRLTSTAFDVAIIDINMPGIDGLTVVKETRMRGPNAATPIVIMTGQKDNATQQNAYEVGATAFFPKPIDWSVFADEIRTIMHRTE